MVRKRRQELSLRTLRTFVSMPHHGVSEGFRTKWHSEERSADAPIFLYSDWGIGPADTGLNRNVMSSILDTVRRVARSYRYGAQSYACCQTIYEAAVM